MLQELIPIVIDVLISHKRPCGVEDIMESSGYDLIDVNKGIHILTEMGLIRQVAGGSTEGDALYSLIPELKAIHLAKAAQLGVDLNAFEQHFKIDKKEKKLALELAAQAEKIKHLDVARRKPLLQKRRYLNHDKTDDVYENLMVLFEASNFTVYEYIENLAKKDAYLRLLLNMHQEAESSLKNYCAQLK